jgi:hypothetical protein
MDQELTKNQTKDRVDDGEIDYGEEILPERSSGL